MSLPSGYKKLEYIQSSGTQYINTGFNPNQNTRVVVDAKPLSVTQKQLWCIFGVRTSVFFELYKASTSNMRLTFLYGSTYTQGFDSLDYTKRHTFEINKNTATVDGTTLTYSAQTFQQAYPLFLFASNNTGKAGGIAAAELYSAKVYDNGTLIRNFIPCKNASGVIGLWDDVNSVFYQNAGSGTFTAGPEIKGANKTLIDGTGYDVKAGKCLVGGTAYAVKKGRTLIGGTGYDISLLSYDPVFANNDWATIIAACQSGEVPDTWTVGDHKDMSINGASYQIDIIGKNHDTYVEGGMAPLTFQMHDCYGTSYSMNDDSMTVVGWMKCTMRGTHLPTILPLMPAVVKNGIRAVNKTTYSPTSGTIVTTQDKLFLLSEIEIFGTITFSVAGEGRQYDYYKAGNSKEKEQNGSSIYWWERSSYSGDFFPSFCLVIGGLANHGQQGIDAGVAFGFCF